VPAVVLCLTPSLRVWENLGIKLGNGGGGISLIRIQRGRLNHDHWERKATQNGTTRKTDVKGGRFRKRHRLDLFLVNGDEKDRTSVHRGHSSIRLNQGEKKKRGI